MPSRDLITQYFLSPELKFISSRSYKSGYLWEVEKLRQSCEICPKCATPSTVRCGRAQAIVRDKSIRDSPLWLKIKKHRYYCRRCRKPFTEPVAGVMPGRRTTQMYRKSLYEKAQDAKNLSRLRKKERISSSLLYRVFYEQAEIKTRELKGRSWPRRIGIDEHFFSRSKGYTEFATVFCNLSSGRIFELGYSKSKKKLVEQLKHIPGREAVQVVAIDLSSGYKSLVRELFPNALIVADKFHVVRLPHPALIKYRKDIHGHRQDLYTRRLLLRNGRKMDYDLRFEVQNYLRNHDHLREIYLAKEKLHELYRTKGVRRAQRGLEKLLEQLAKSQIPELQKLKRTLFKWRKEILRYFELGVTNALSEAINSIAKRLQQSACGYKSFKNYRLAVLTACAF